MFSVTKQEIPLLNEAASPLMTHDSSKTHGKDYSNLFHENATFTKAQTFKAIFLTTAAQ